MINFSDLIDRLQNISFSSSSVIYVLGDIHANPDWKRLYRIYKKDNSANKKFVFLGDLSDRCLSRGLSPSEQAYEWANDEKQIGLLKDISKVLSTDKDSYLILGNHELVYFATNLVWKYQKANEEFSDYKEKFNRLHNIHVNLINTAINTPRLYITFNNWILSHIGFSNELLEKNKAFKF